MKFLIPLLLAVLALTGCDDNNADDLKNKARIEGEQQARAQLEEQLKQKDALVEKARAEGKAVAEEEFKTQLAHQDELVQKARAEGRAQAEEQLKLQNGNLNAKAKKMEDDLATRQRFYQASSGTYEGNVQTEQGNYNIRITLVPSLPPYPTGRVRQLEEITSDLTNLYFNAQVVQWNPANNLSSVGCRVENIRPDLVRGNITIASSSCPNLYVLNVTDTNFDSRNYSGQIETYSTGLATKIRTGKLNLVSGLFGEVRPTTNASIYPVIANRVRR